eukprot:934407_1
MLDITPSSSPNTNSDLQWICCVCTFHNHSLLKKCEICAAEMTKYCKWKEIATQLHDQLASFRTRPFKINGIEIQPKTEFKLLGQWFDDKWTFNKQITTRIQAINLIRINAVKLLKASNHALNLGLIKTYLSSSALSLLNYAGCILYTA